MKYIKTYENLFKKIGSKLSDLLSGDSDYKVYDADFNTKEKSKLKELNFKKLVRNVYQFKSESTNLEIVIEKKWIEDVPGHADKKFEINILNNKGILRKNESDFDKVISLFKTLIPEIDLVINKYNI